MIDPDEALARDRITRLTRATDDARRAFGQGNIDEHEFKVKLTDLGFDRLGIEAECDQHRPGLKPIGQAASRVLKGLEP